MLVAVATKGVPLYADRQRMRRSVAYGYADQSHPTRECVRLAGDTPAAQTASSRPSAAGALGQLSQDASSMPKVVA
jgi:hypothetical protein